MKTFLSSIQATAIRLTFLPWLLALLVGLLLTSTNFDSDVEQRFGNLRADIMERPASGKLVLIEIDANSLQQLERWPFSRKYYARAIEKLNQAGAAQIAFDVDFSSHSTQQQDQLLADAIENSEATIILPTFRQRQSTGSSKFVESLPIASLRENAFLASVNVSPDNRGQLNQYSYGTMTADTARPSLASMLAETSGNIDQSFAIDKAIDITTIPTLSFVDLLQSDVPPPMVRGKKVLIGATAIELGDRYPTSRFGIVPGVILQAMASETLIRGTNLIDLGKFPALLISAILLLACTVNKKISPPALIRIALAAILVLSALVLLVEYLRLFTFSVAPAFFFLALYMLAQKFLTTMTALKTSQYFSETSGLPNETVLTEVIAAKDSAYIVTARFTDFRELLVLTNKETRLVLFQNLANRLSLLAENGRIFHVDTDMVAWIVHEDYMADIPGYFETAKVLLQAPVMASETKIKINATFGISSGSLDESKIASEQALAAGTKWAWHDYKFDHAIGEKHDLLLELDQAIEEHNLGVVYQPKWDLQANRLDGAEALVRWNHPVRGSISPEIFIPLLEKAGRIDALTSHVLERALHDMEAWQKVRPGLTCSVNISAKLFGDKEFVHRAIAMVEDAKVENFQIVFEVTETATMADPELSGIAMKMIQNAGIRVSIDDYGTGQSTMSYLQRLPVSEIKLDQSFVKTMTTDNGNRVMVKSTITMAHALGFKIVAEGIEDQACMALLTRYKCDIGQGWHISKPVSAKVFEADWLNSRIEAERLSA